MQVSKLSHDCVLNRYIFYVSLSDPAASMVILINNSQEGLMTNKEYMRDVAVYYSNISLRG